MLFIYYAKRISDSFLNSSKRTVRSVHFIILKSDFCSYRPSLWISLAKAFTLKFLVFFFGKAHWWVARSIDNRHLCQTYHISHMAVKSSFTHRLFIKMWWLDLFTGSKKFRSVYGVQWFKWGRLVTSGPG